MSKLFTEQHRHGVDINMNFIADNIAIEFEMSNRALGS